LLVEIRDLLVFVREYNCENPSRAFDAY
jgi:hypothetical protein